MTEYTCTHYYDGHPTSTQKIMADNVAQAIDCFKAMLIKEGAYFTNADTFEAEEDFI